MIKRKAGAPRNNVNRAGRGTKEKPRIQISMSISDHAEVSEGVYADLRGRFEDYLLAQGVQPTVPLIKQVARDWAYEIWWQRLSKAEDEQAAIC